MTNVKKSSEIWIKTPISNDYEVSNFGRAKSLKFNREKILSQFKLRGYYAIGINRKAFTVHRLIAKCFIKNELNKREVNHIDGDKFNNHSSNLEWCTRKENMIHASKSGLLYKISGSNCHTSKLSKKDVLNIRKFAKNTKYFLLAKMYGVSGPTISEIVNRVTWKYI